MSLMSYNLYSGPDTRTGYNAPWEPVSEEGTVVRMQILLLFWTGS